MDTPDSHSSRRFDLAAVVCLMGVVFLVFVDVLFGTDSRVVSHATGDTAQFFTRMRGFGFGEIREGRLPLWNPYLMSGTPFVGNFQSALFYPPNWMYAFLAVERATNVDYALHMFLAAAFMFAWCRGRGIGSMGAVVAALVFVGSAPFSLRILAGHITMVQAMAWAPLILLAVDKVIDAGVTGAPRLGWVLLGTGATAMQILAGHPQTVFITGGAVAMYCGLRLLGAEERLRTIGALTCIGTAPLVLAAIQLLPGLQTMDESLRSGGTDEYFATSFSFPPENLLTLFAPAFFSDRVHAQYWGSWAFWDACAFMGIAGLALAVLGARSPDAWRRRYAPFMVFVLVLLAMGAYTSVYELVSRIPVFGVLRGSSKFLFAAMLFASLLAGLGFDRIRYSLGAIARLQIATFLASTGAALGLGAIAVAVAARPPYDASPWRGLLQRQLRYNLFDTSFYAMSPDYFTDTARIATISLLLAGATCLVASVLFWRGGRSRAAVVGIGVLAVVEALGFARVYRVTFDHDDLRDAQVEALYTRDSGDYRVMHLAADDRVSMRNHPMLVRQSAVWGYEPVMLSRYGTLMARAAGGNYGRLGQMKFHARFGSDVFKVGLGAAYFDLHEDPAEGTVDLSNMLDIARCRYVIVPEGVEETPPGIYTNPDALPRFLLLRDYIVIPQREGAREAVDDAGVDPRRAGVLEQPPERAPTPGTTDFEGTVQLEEESGDHMVLRIETNRPAILLVTDSYSEGWRIDALPDSDQQSYTLVPANFAFRGVALEAGSHHLQMEYLPRAFVLGRNLTLTGAGIYFLAVGIWLARRRQRAKNAA